MVHHGGRTGAAGGAGLDDVARLAGVSLSTASRALNNHPQVAAATRERVLAAAAGLDYVVSPDASRLAGGSSRARVAVVVPHLSRWFFGRLLEGLEVGLRGDDPRGVDQLLFLVGDVAGRRAFFEDLPARRRVDAAVVVGFEVDEAEQRRLELLGVSIVSAGGPSEPFPSVTVDDHRAGRQAVDHLVHLGHRRIGMLATLDPADRGPDRRTQAYRTALVDAGVPDDPELLVRVAFGAPGGADGMSRLLGLRRPPTAVFAYSDEIAAGAVRTLRRAGLRVPEDVSVVGIDDHPIAELLDLTTVAQPVHEQGVVAGRMVRTLLAGGEPPPSRVLPTQLVLRGTTAPPREAAP
ncbi:LacI family DNA-binding transcriptional regulator [Actinomycetospora termitidis]|uniref:LacI family DNA-binding transcriptional regulator n=1 Tax=Actinomycetospora termitidis TaxID=3053470 RepID=A0ABT7M2Q7_9PSEU|nr:LacI family DNA-binding transcriptional regulator [Actinomycetospora sp. Odt1-22]MDL5154939.1 LacI family DNA-binding transcriptional regulator [Actinomycetospora sp. Odt1-22]